MVETIIKCGGDTQPLIVVKKIELFALSGGGDTKTVSTSTHAHAYEPPGETFTT